MAHHPIVETGPNMTRQVLADHPEMMVVAAQFTKAGAVGAMHDHPHIQSVFVQSGRFQFTVGTTVTEVGPGDSFVVPSGVPHGCLCLEPGTVIDGFTPRRDDFL